MGSAVFLVGDLEGPDPRPPVAPSKKRPAGEAQRQQQYLDRQARLYFLPYSVLSRGRGIKCLSDLTDILDYSLGKETQYVVQKYI